MTTSPADVGCARREVFASRPKVAKDADARGAGGPGAGGPNDGVSGFSSDSDVGAPRGRGPNGAILGPINGAVYATPAAAGTTPGPVTQRQQKQQQLDTDVGSGFSRGARKGSVYAGFGSMDA